MKARPNAGLLFWLAAWGLLGCQGKELVRVRVLPPGRPDLAFSLLLPANWRAEVSPGPSSNQKGEIALLARLYEADDLESTQLTVKVLYLPVEVDLSEWAEVFLREHWSEIIGLAERPAGTLPGVRARVRLRREDKTISALVYLVKNGPYIYVLESAGGGEHWLEQAKLASPLLASFRASQPVAEPYGEPMDIVTEKGPPAFRFRIPSSWKREHFGMSSNEFRAIDLQRWSEGQRRAFLRVVVRAHDFPQAAELVEKQLLDSLALSGVALRRKLRETSWGAGLGKSGYRVVVWEAFWEKLPLEAAVAVLQRQDVWAGVGLLVPVLEREPLSWLAGWRAFSLVVSDLLQAPAAEPEVIRVH